MKGKDLNNLVKTIGALKVDVVPMVSEMAIVDAPHVCMMEIARLDKSPIFDVESEYLVDCKDLLKLPDSEEFTAKVDGVKYLLENADYRYSFNLVDEEYSKPRVPKFNPWDFQEVTVSAKKIRDIVSSLKGISDYVTVECDGDRVTMSVKTDTKEVKRTVGDCRFEFKSMFPFDYVKRISDVLVGDVTMRFNFDFPTVWTWSDGCYEYRYLLAPRVERS